MSKYLEMLRALDNEKHPPKELPKLPKAGVNSTRELPKAPFGSFGSSRSECFSKTLPTSGPPLHRCQCGVIACHGVGYSLREPERARWYCAACLPVDGRA